MSETGKTGLFAAGAAVSVVLAALMVYANSPSVPVDIVGLDEPFFNAKDPLAVTSMEILRFDKDTNRPIRFEVGQHDGIWSIPSHDNYPADAEDQLKKAATEVMGLEKLNFVSQDRTTQKLYGVVDPEKAKVGESGVGVRVTLRDAKNKALADIIVGDAVKDKPSLHYVRDPQQDHIYVCKVDPAKFSTKFDDWIEDDLLKLSDWDVRRVVLHDYSIDEARGTLVGGDVVALTYTDQASGDNKSWTLKDAKPGMELDETKLNDMRKALGDLKIVNVARKPEGIGASLGKEEGAELANSDLVNLQRHGFLWAQTSDGATQLFSNDGEVRVTMKDGVEYVLRFGNVTAGSDEKQDQTNRYLLVTTEFRPDMIDKPQLEALPGAAAGPQPEGAEGQPVGKPAQQAEPQQKTGATVDDLEEIKNQGLKTSEEAEAERKKKEADEEAERTAHRKEQQAAARRI